MSDPAPRLPLLEALQALKPNTVFSMAGRKELSAAAQDFSAQIVHSFHWGESGSLLRAKLDSGEGQAILLSCQDGKLVTSGVPAGCHTNRKVVATLMTILRVLHGTKFHGTDLRPEVLEKFRRQLQAPKPAAAKPRVVVTCVRGRALFDYDSGLREASWRVAGPPPGMEWLVWQDREPARVAQGFLDWLAGGAAGAEVFFDAGGGAWKLTRASGARLRAGIRLQAGCEEVTITRAVILEGGHEVPRFMDLGFGMVFLPDEQVFAVIEPQGAWSTFSEITGQRPKEFSHAAPAHEFFLPSAVAADCELRDASGGAATPVSEPLRGQVDAVTGGDRVRVRLRVMAESGAEVPVRAKASKAFESLFADGPFTLLVGSCPRRQALAKGLSDLLLEESEASREARLAALPGEAVFTSRAMHGDDAARCLRALHRTFDAWNAPHLTTAPKSGAWLSARNSAKLLASCLRACCQALPSADPLKSMDLDLDGAEFYRRLPALHAACRSAGVDLRVDDQQARVESVSISIRLTRGAELDWFELHPETRAGALTIPREAWAMILRTGFFREENGSLVAFDEDSLSRLHEVAGVVGEGSRVPRLRLFDWMALRATGVACECPPEEEALLDSLLQLDRIPEHPVPPLLKADLREYQKHGFSWLCFLYRHRLGGCLADDMGLGKTLQAIALLAALKDGSLARQAPGRREPHLVVVPPSLLFNWQNEMRRFAPDLAIQEYTGAGRSADFSQADVVVTTYDLVRRDIGTLSGIAFDVAIFDEAQAVKNAAAARARAVTGLKARFRLCLTGTPLENHIGELHSIMETAVPGLLGERRDFQRDQEAGRPVLGRIRPFLLRRTKENILSELPPKVESDSYFALSDPQKELYTRTVGEVRSEVLAAYEGKPAQQAGIIALAALMKLRQICISPALLDGGLTASSPKIDHLTEQLAELAEEGHAALVFSQFVKALDLVGEALEAAGMPFLRLDGSTPAGRRKTLVESFQDGTAPGIFLISLKAGGVGLNLTRASYVFHLDPWWNPAVENQASDRVHRIGQQRSVFIQRLLMRHTIEEKMMSLKRNKQALFDAVVGGTCAPGGAPSLTASDFQFLIS